MRTFLTLAAFILVVIGSASATRAANSIARDASSASAVTTPPGPPNNPSPPDGAEAVGNPLFQWQAAGAVWYYFYLDFFSHTQPLAVLTTPSYQLPWTLTEGTYTWRVEATNGYGGWSAGPTWTFTVGPGIVPNDPPDAPDQPNPANGSTAENTYGLLFWHASDPDHQPLKFDVYFGTDPSPPKVASNGYNVTAYDPGPLTFSATYHWRVVARDPMGAETSSPTWSYTTKAPNEPPNAPVPVLPVSGATVIPINTLLKWQGGDPEDQPVNFDVYLGTEANAPMIADHVQAVSYTPGLLAPGTEYHWHLVARDPFGLERTGQDWTFTTANTVNLMPDAPNTPNPKYSNQGGPTPFLAWNSVDPDDAYLPGDTLRFDVYFGSGTNENYTLQLIGTTTGHTFQVGPLTEHVRYFWRAVARDDYWTVRGPLWFFDNGTVAVLFSRFDARQAGDHVEVRWLLHSDEAMDTYTLYRRAGETASPVAVATAPVTGVEGVYKDASVEAGKTYHYELLVRTTDGDEFRSPVATVSMPALTLALHQNVPNPFNPRTVIRYDMPSAARVRLQIIDVSGRKVRTLVEETQSAGSRSVVWNGRDDSGSAVASGVYFYVLDVDKQRLTRKLVLLK